MVQRLCLGLVRPARGAAGRFSGIRSSVTIRASTSQARWVHQDDRPRLSRTWVPTGGISATENEDAHAKLIRAGYVRQSHSGLFQMLPFGLRVQEKIEKLIDGHMQGLGASKLALSTISSQALWEKSGRLSSVSSELFLFEDRKEVPLLLSPTHEEEITSLVARTLKSYKELPLRLYQITRKYRDEFRPRHGLLRGREFIMKDLYTFDPSVDKALATYEEVRQAYVKFFADLKLPVLVAKASSGDMGGDLSHEYHLPTSLGEDNVVSCDACEYVVNDELAQTRSPTELPKITDEIFRQQLSLWRGITKDRTRLVHVWYLNSAKSPESDGETSINIHAIKSLIPDLDTSIQKTVGPVIARALAEGSVSQSHIEVVSLFDERLAKTVKDQYSNDDAKVKIQDAFEPSRFHCSEAAPPAATLAKLSAAEHHANLVKIKSDDPCPKCATGKLHVQKAIELGHTFHLGTRYSQPLEATVQLPSGGNPVPLQMGCHGIGVSRIIGVVANHLADDKGLNWPRKIAPYEVVVIAKNEVQGDAEAVYDQIVKGGEGEVDAILDDRWSTRFPWRMKDAELIGYPVVVLLGKGWAEERKAEVQCRRLGVKELVPAGEVPAFVRKLLEQL